MCSDFHRDPSILKMSIVKIIIYLQNSFLYHYLYLDICNLKYIKNFQIHYLSREGLHELTYKISIFIDKELLDITYIAKHIYNIKIQFHFYR